MTMPHRAFPVMGLFLSGVLSMAAVPPAYGAADTKGTRIAAEADRRDEGFGDTRARIEMILARVLTIFFALLTDILTLPALLVTSAE